MKKILFTIIIIVLLCMAVRFPGYVNASSGLPGSARFGYGAILDVDGFALESSVELASTIGLDWIKVEFDWEKRWPDPNSPPDISRLNDVINLAHHSGLNVLLTISNPALWVITDKGPDPQTIANLTLSLIEFSQDKVSAVELFPGVNTQHGWKSKPDAISYLTALRKTQETLDASGKQTYIITTLSPPSIHASDEDIDDLEYLNDLYTANAKPYLTILGMSLNHITGDPYSEPGPFALRHYEEIRSVMLKNNHSDGRLWVTGFSLPIMHPSNTLNLSLEESRWLESAFSLLKAQLYIGAAFLDRINPSLDANIKSLEFSLISSDEGLHPAAEGIRQMISRNTTDTYLAAKERQDTDQISSPKSNNHTYLSILLKKYIRQDDLK